MLDIQQKAINQTAYKVKSNRKIAEKEMSAYENDIDSIERESLLSSAHTYKHVPEPGQAIQALTLTHPPSGLDVLTKPELILTVGPQPIQARIESKGPASPARSPTRIKADGYSISQTPQSGTPNDVTLDPKDPKLNETMR